jgi:PAS domain S-box-containing protein
MTAQQQSIKSSTKMSRKASPAKARILLVDDDERNLMAMSEVLENLAEVVTATSGREALRHLLKGDFAVILLDVFMPGMDGYETATLIRKREQTARIPIIFLSAVNKETEHLMRGYAMGAVDYVFKPVDPLILRSKVSVFVDLYKMRLQVEEKSRAEQELRDANFQAELDRLRIERELEASRKRQAAIIQSLPIVLYMESSATEPRRPDFVSGNLEAMTGFSFEHIGGNPTLWQERLHPEDRDRVLAALVDRQTSGRFSIEYRWKCADGSYRHFHDQAVLLHDGDAAEFAGTLTDVTEQRLLESQLIQAQKMDAIGQLTGGVAHDFNNLLAAVLGGLHVLQRRLKLEERDQAVVDHMRHAAEQGAELVRRMMAFARKQELSPSSVDPKSLCTAVAGLVEHTLGGTVKVDWSCPESSSNIYVDRPQLELALVNLILNARDAMPEGGRVEVAIEDIGRKDKPAELGLGPGDYVRIRVRDEGQGIRPELIDRITEPFFTTKEAGKGTGLGLSMVIGFVQQSGGRLQIGSQEGAGSTIDLYLPATNEKPATEAPRQKEPAKQGNPSVRSLLLVDDDDAVRTVLGEQLKEMEIDVVAVPDGDSALALLGEGGREFDLLLTDFAMPGKNGMETIKMAKKQRPKMRSVLMTGYADEELRSQVRDSIPVLRKPINLDELRRALN